jgi:tripartite-type tricarboxylate transporter receptor subunit TctC
MMTTRADRITVILQPMKPLLAALYTVLVSLQALPSLAQSYPERPVRIIVPFAPGGVADNTARLIARHLSDTWGKPFVVENRPGAASIIAFTAVAKAPADGYTLLYANTNIATNASLYGNLQYDAERDLVPVALAVITPGVLVVHPSLAATTLDQLLAIAKQRPGTLNYASVGQGSFPHLAMEMLKQLAGIDVVHVPYKGFAPAMTAILANEVNVMLLDPSAALPQMKAGKLRGLAVSGSRRMQALPELPTIAELGLKDYEAVGWLGIMAPTGTPRETVTLLNAEINRGLAKPEVQARFAATGVETSLGSPDDFGAFIQRHRTRWAKVINAGGIKGEQ